MKSRVETVGKKLLAIANESRKANVATNILIAMELKDNMYTEYEAAKLLEFIEIFRTGAPKKQIIEELQLSEKLVERLDKHKLVW